VSFVHHIFSIKDINKNIILFVLIKRTTKTGGLPHLSFIARKPEPLGTEFKNLVDGVTGAMLWLEIQEGKERMKKKQFQNMGSTAACVMRGVAACGSTFMNLPIIETEERIHEPRLFFGDSWFGSVKAAVEVGKTGHHACFMVKTGHTKSPKKFLENKMKDYPGGTWITMRATVDEVDLVSIGYKYNKKKLLTFVMTKGAGSTRPGEPYVARFPDSFGNVCIRHIARPAVISHFFDASNKVDLHNQSRQFSLRLEKKWVTTNPYFRLYQTMTGMVVTDAWKLFRICGQLYETITEFVNVLVSDIIKEAEMLEEATKTQDVPAVSLKLKSSTSSMSSITLPDKKAKEMIHTKVFLKDKKQVRCMWCSRVELVERKTTMKCFECNAGFCRSAGCWSHHVAIGGVPRAPKRGTKKRKICEIIE